MMAKLLRMPEIAANTRDAVLQEWLVPDHTLFAANDTVASVETDKASVDVPAEEAGVILKRLVDEGARVEVGTPIAVVGGVGEQVADMAALLAELGVASGPPKPSVPGDTGSSGPPKPLVHNPTGRTPSEWDSHVPGGPPISILSVTTDNGRQVGSSQPGAAKKFASPLARRLAKEAGLPIEEIAGTGPGGRVVRRDVQAVIAARAPAPLQAAGYTEIPHTRIRRVIAARLTESTRTAPHFYLRATVRVDKLLKLRARLNKQNSIRISVNDLIVKAAARAHTLVPEMNVIWTPDAVRRFNTVDIGVAVATDRGLLAPVLTDVAGRSITDVAEASAKLAERAKAGRLKPDELTGGTLTVTNLGMFGTEEFAAIINPPQAAILAVGAARQEPLVRKGRLTVGTVLHVTLSVDHRPVDGVVAARWLAAFVETVEKPLRILA